MKSVALYSPVALGSPDPVLESNCVMPMADETVEIGGLRGGEAA